MGMSTHVIGIKPPDEVWKKMKAAWDACESAGVPIPESVVDFFDGETPDEAGVVLPLNRHECVKRYNCDSQEGFEVDVSKLPVDVKIVRFVNSW